jgi:glycosyltransferase involved in cell wall biosynthesis
MMALANLLEHPRIKDDLIEDTNIKRSNKDLGRVLAIARLTPEEMWETWPAAWAKALKDLAADPARRATLGAAAHAAVMEKFTVRRMMDEYQDAYDAVASR